jgi:hypothetical protein
MSVILDFGFWILDFGFWILDSGFWILDFGFWILDSGFWIRNERAEVGLDPKLALLALALPAESALT